MLRAIGFGLQILLLTLIAYNLMTALWGWPDPTRAPRGARRQRFVVVIPAHDEAGVVTTLVTDLRASDYPADAFTVWVIADRCTDATAAASRAAGASVAERTSGEGGKGAALAWFLERHPLGEGDALVVFDADNRVSADLLGRFADEIERGATVVQAYVDTTRPGESWVSLASALSYWAGNRMVQLSRHNLGWSPELAGTGMALSAEALSAVGGFRDSLVEDRELSVRLALAGIRVTWMHDVRVRDEKPVTVGVVVRQRARWAAGKRQVARRHLGRLLGTGLRRREWRHIDQALRLVQPSRAFVAVISAGLAIGAVFESRGWFLPWPVWVAAAGAQFLLPLPFLVRDRVPWRWVLGYPLLAGLAVLWIPIQIVSRRVGGWSRTPHRGDA